MRLQLNDEHLQCPAQTTLATLLNQRQLLPEGIALAVNQTIVPREQWDQYLLCDGDTILLFQAIAGG